MAKVVVHKPTHIFEYEIVDSMTISLWNLQLQLFELSEQDLILYFNTIFISHLYEENRFTQKILNLCMQEWPMSEQERLCLATHIAVQLLGLGDL
jgi:hypothetical protein